MPLTSRSKGRRAIFAVPAFSRPNVEYLAELMESGRLTAVVDRTFPLAEAAAAIRDMASGRARGQGVLTEP